MTTTQDTQNEQASAENAIDERLRHTLDSRSYKSENEVTDSDYDRIEDDFIQGANDLIYTGEKQIEALIEAGFTELAGKFKNMSAISGAYDWARENL